MILSDLCNSVTRRYSVFR